MFTFLHAWLWTRQAGSAGGCYKACASASTPCERDLCTQPCCLGRPACSAVPYIFLRPWARLTASPPDA